MAIPKIIHQTYFVPQGPGLPPAIAENIAQLKRDNPDWEHRFYDDAAIAQFIQAKCSPDVWEAYQRINPQYGAARADFFRYLVMYYEGGIYLDIKSSAVRPLSNIIHPDDRFVLAHWPNRPDQRYAGWGFHGELPTFCRGEFQQWHIIAAPRHSFLCAVIGEVMRNINRYNAQTVGVGSPGVLRTTGPIAYSRAIQAVLPTAPHRLAGDSDELGLVYSRQHSATEHQQWFPGHYSTLTAPVILPPVG